MFINRSPEAYFELPLVVCVGDTVEYDGTGSYEPDGGLLRYEWPINTECTINPTQTAITPVALPGCRI